MATALALVCAGAACALEVVVGPPREHGGYVLVDARLSDPFGERIEESLGRGMPATLQVHGELWRRRDGWFDRLESSTDAAIRVRYEVWRDQFRIDRDGAASLRVGTIDSVEVMLGRPWAIPVGRVGQVQPRTRYYVVVFATLKPLSVEDVAEVEGWLSGEVEDKRHAGLGVITELPRSLFDAVRNFAGFGDRRARVVSSEFELRDLFAAGPRGSDPPAPRGR
jgi:hypothetical protein